ncbi:MAG: NAD(P)H-dependent dehydrogenase/reductase [Chlorobiaceae bacterium]|nr:NAD(P)H-dependent dehydrogenase/reductase [Chlorobiaceae bacterium]
MIELLRKRRSIRKFTPENVSRESLQTLIEAALRSPSSRGINPWEFIVVDEPELITELSKVKQSGSAFLKGAPLAVVVCADATKSDVWVEDTSIAAIIIQLVATSLGLGSCWIQIRKRQHDTEKTAESRVRELLGLPPQITVASILAIGYPAEQKLPVPMQELQHDKVRFNSWS